MSLRAVRTIPARSTTEAVGVDRRSTAAANVPVGCSKHDVTADRRTSTLFAGLPGSSAAVATETAREHADGIVAPVGDEHPGAQVAAVAGAETMVSFGTVVSETSPRFISIPAVEADRLEAAAQLGVGIEFCAVSHSP